MQNIKNAANYVSETVQGTGAEASKEANKSIAKDSNVPIGTRARAAGDMLSDKMDQHSHEKLQSLVKSSNMIALRHTAFRVLSKPSPSLTRINRSIKTLTPVSVRPKPLRVPISHLQLRFASGEAQTQSEPVADREEEGQHGNNSIAASSPEETQFTEESNASRIPEAAPDAPVTEQPSDSQSAHDDQPASTLGEFVSAAGEKVKETASNALGAFGEPRGSGLPKANPPPSETVYVGNLFFDVREDDIRTEFEKIGPIKDVKLIMDNRGLSRGFGYVTFDSVATAQTAISVLDQVDFQGRRLTVAYANSRMPSTRPFDRRYVKSEPSRTLFIGNMAFGISDRELNNLFRDIRNVVDVRVAIDRRTGQPRGFAHADFTDLESAQEAMVELAGKQVSGRALRVDYSESASTHRIDRMQRSGEEQQQGY
ncbi:MAG: hypothetical protein Q9216_006214 [Gyalolechia sp. 2 TL-2023]